MLALLTALAVVFLGLVLNSNILVGFGFIALALTLILDYLKPRPTPVAQAAAVKPRIKHKLINAPEDAWKVQEDDIWQAMMTGPSPMSIGGQSDFMGQAALPDFNNPHTSGILRGMLPFQNYGRQGAMGAVENMFIGFPIGIGNFLQR